VPSGASGPSSLVGIPQLTDKIIGDQGIGSRYDQATISLSQGVVEDWLDSKRRTVGGDLDLAGL